MKYTIEDFNLNFPDDDSCLEHVWKSKHSRLRGYHRIPGRMGYANRTGRQIYPLKGTIFERSTTPLRLWFFAIYLFSQSKHGVTAMELKRQIGVTYKCAWRMCARIRTLMQEDSPVTLSGMIECDEAYVGGRRRLAVRGRNAANKTPVFGMVERGGRVHAEAVSNCSSDSLIPIIRKHVPKRSRIMTDEWKAYSLLRYYKKYTHKTVKHSAWEYVRVEGRTKIHTNTIEGFWSGLKKQVSVHHFVSRKHLQSYVDEVVFRYNHRKDGPLFPILLRRV